MAENGQENLDKTKITAGSRPSSAARGQTIHWFAYVGPDPQDLYEDNDKETRIKSFKEKQNEERQKKLDDIKATAMAAQRFKEQKEHERRQRLDEMRVKEDVRRQQVEERKRAINDAERDRLESILKRNQEREARIDAKKHPHDNSGTFWGHRRATSTQNITYSAAPLTRRQSERELDGGSKKRATSAGGLERSGEDLRMTTSMYEVFHWENDTSPKSTIPSFPAQAITRSTSAHFASASPSVPAGCVSGYIGRRRTDLMPTIPSRDASTTPPRKPFTRSPAPSRPSSSLSQQSTSSITSSVHMRSKPIATPRRQRPASIAITGITSELKNGTFDLKRADNKPPLPKVRKSSLGKSQEKIKKRSLTSPTEGSPKTILSPTNTNVSLIQSPTDSVSRELENIDRLEDSKNIIPENEVDRMESVVSEAQLIQLEDTTIIENKQICEVKDDVIVPKEEIEQLLEEKLEEPPEVKEPLAETMEEIAMVSNEENLLISIPASIDLIEKIEDKLQTEIDGFPSDGDMSGSFISKVRITTEEEAKAALAERRRLIREEAEKQAELERRRKEEEERLEFERQQREEEQQRTLIEQQRVAEQERLEEAIKEAQKREEEERVRREEEQRLKVIKEEADRKAKEEAEKQKAELQERLKNEEKEREARRKRVEAIMLRTRGKTNPNSPSQNDEQGSEKIEKVNGSKSVMTENGHKNGKDIEAVDNIIPVDSLKNANTVTGNTLGTDDTINSNDAWQRNNQTDLLM